MVLLWGISTRKNFFFDNSVTWILNFIPLVSFPPSCDKLSWPLFFQPAHYRSVQACRPETVFWHVQSWLHHQLCVLKFTQLLFHFVTEECYLSCGEVGICFLLFRVGVLIVGNCITLVSLSGQGLCLFMIFKVRVVSDYLLPLKFILKDLPF